MRLAAVIAASLLKLHERCVVLFSTYCRDVLQIHKRAETGYTDHVRSVQLKDKRALNRGIQSVKFSVNPVHTHVIISNSVTRPIPRVSCSVVQALNGNVTTRWFKWRRSQLDPRSLPSARSRHRETNSGEDTYLATTPVNQNKNWPESRGQRRPKLLSVRHCFGT